ncbi:MAG TPA: cytochrome P450 [Acidimicrobiales bacterium]|nr:cytochrome P450 [Acidimicrobiales bacterium]
MADNAPSAPPDLDLGSAAMQSAPHAVLADLRRSAGPVLWSGRHRAWLVLGHEAAAAAFKDDRLSSDRMEAFGRVSAAGARAMESYLTGLLEHYRRHPDDNLLSALGPLAGSTSGLSDREVAGGAMLLLFAGHETTTTLIANSVWCLLGHPDQLRRVGSDPALWSSAIDELLRYEAPSKVMVRKVGAPTELAGRRLTPGQTVFVVIAAANRDDAVFPDPDDLDLGRHPNPHLAFGWGRHHCLGAALARLEARVCLSSLFARFPRLNTTCDAPDWAGGIIGRAVRAVPVSTA